MKVLASTCERHRQSIRRTPLMSSSSGGSGRASARAFKTAATCIVSSDAIGPSRFAYWRGRTRGQGLAAKESRCRACVRHGQPARGLAAQERVDMSFLCAEAGELAAGQNRALRHIGADRVHALAVLPDLVVLVRTGREAG